MIDTNHETLFKKGIESLARNEWTSALACFEKATGLRDNPIYKSYLALCIARERGQTNRAVSMCMDALESDPESSVIYLNLGKIYLMQGKPEEAIKAFRNGLGQEGNDQIVEELERIGTRRPSPLSFLKRDHPINKYLGILLARVGVVKYRPKNNS
jgi:predicted Zn-dependent protease